MAFLAGLGSKNSIGFGCIETFKNQKSKSNRMDL